MVLCLLDLSAAFDTLKHSVLIDRLREIGLQDKALEWFQSYLSDRRMAVKIKEHVSELQVVKYGVPQGSVLGPMLFNVYCLPLTTLIRKYGVSYHVYADDTQVYVECDKNDPSSAYATFYACINDIKEWLSSNFLLLNDKKTELIEYNSNSLNQNNHLVIGNTVIDTQPCVTNLGCVLDVGLVMSGHAARMCNSAYHHLRCIRKIRNCIPMEACKLLVHSLVTSRLDYSNALLCGARDDVIKQAPNDTAYKRWSCHSGFKLLCKLCRTSTTPAMGARFTVFGHAGHADPLDGWRCCSQKRVMSRPIQVRQL